MDIAEIAGRSLFQQDPRVSISSITGGGERLDLQYRFRPGRPRFGVRYSALAPWGGVWSANGTWERQPFDTPLVETAERVTGRLAWTDWISGHFQVSARGGADDWQDIGTRGALGGTAFVTSLDDRVSLRLDVDAWLGETQFSSAKTIAKYRSSTRNEGLVFFGIAGAGVASDGLPTESWFAGDSGNARPGPVPLRAHALVQDSRYFRTEQMGRSIVHGSGEGQYWFRLRRASGANTGSAGGGIGGLLGDVRMAVAVFVDSARVTRRLYDGDRNDVDLGGGIRVGLGGRGSLRVDYGYGLIHDDSKFSVDFEF
jgi:hypothetical protein